MKVVVAGRVSIGVSIDDCEVVVCPEVLDAVVPVDDEVDVDCPFAPVASASINAAAITTRFNIRTSASQTDTAGSYIQPARKPARLYAPRRPILRPLPR